MKRILSSVLALVLMLSTIFSVNVFAKVNLPTISKSKPLTTYTYNSSGKVYAYTASNLKTKTGGYIACSTDECKIIDISGKAVKVIYPVPNGTKTAWFSRDAFTKRNLANDAAASSFKAQTKATTYKWKGKSNTFGSVAKGDKCYLLRGNENSDWVQIIYPVSKGHKMGWVKGSDYAKMIGATPTPEPEPEITTSDWQYPMKNAYCTWETKTNMSWSGYNDDKGKDHIGIDIYGDKGNVYSTAKGKVVACSSSNSGANGRYIIIEHTLNGKKIYSFYAHLSSVKVKKGDPVTQSTQIGVAGGSGYNKNNYYGTHLHFAIVDTLWSNGKYWGYADTFSNSSNKKDYSGVVYYNPSYVIKYNKLP